MKRYEKYKPTRIIWIGDTPNHWQETKLKFIGYLYAGLTGKSGDDFKQTDNPQNKPFIPFTNIANNLKINPNQLEKVVMTEDDEQNKVEKNDLFFMMSSENFDDVGKATILLDDLGECYLNSFCKGFRVTDKNVNPPYLNYLLLNDAYRRRLMIEANGFTRINLKMEKVNDFEISLPPLEEQTTIANFLDEKTSQIDKLISNKQKLIELLKEERTAIINEAVSGKGKYWERKKLKYLVSKVGSGITPSGGANVYLREGIPFLRSQNIYPEGLVLDDVAYISEEIDEQMSNSRIQEGDVLLNISGASIGRCFYVPKDLERGNVNQHVCIIRPIQSKISTEYLHSFLVSNYGQTLIDICQNGANREGLNFQQIKSFELLLPKISEQKEILKHIQTETQSINKIILKIEKEIELMQEYRTALISEVVTGKLDVREYANKNAEIA